MRCVCFEMNYLILVISNRQRVRQHHRLDAGSIRSRTKRKAKIIPLSFVYVETSRFGREIDR